MDRLSDCIQRVHSRWLASSISCCFPRLPDQSELEIPGMCLGFTMRSNRCTDSAQLMLNAWKYVINSPDRFSCPRSMRETRDPSFGALIIRRNGSWKDDSVPRGHRAGQASSDIRPAGDPRSVHHLISEEWNDRADVATAFDRWN